MSTSGSSRSDSPQPQIRVTYEGPALEVQINGNSYTIKHLKVMRAGTNYWSDVNISDPAAQEHLAHLVTAVQTLAARLGPKFDLANAETFSLISSRTVTPSNSTLPFSFKRLVWTPPGSPPRTLELHPEQESQEVQKALQDIGRHMQQVLDISAPTGPIIPVPGDGNCMISALRSSERNLRQRMADKIRNDARFRDAMHLDGIRAAINAMPNEERAQFNDVADDALVGRYADHIQQDQVYLDSPSLEALALVLEHPIAVIQDQYRLIQFFPDDSGEKGLDHAQTIFIHYTPEGKHYNAVRKEDAAIQTLIQEQKERDIQALRTENDPLRAADQISTIRLHFPVVFNALKTRLDCLPNATDGDVAVALLATENFDWTTL